MLAASRWIDDDLRRQCLAATQTTSAAGSD